MKKYTVILFLALITPTINIHAQYLEAYLVEAAENNPGIKARYSEFEAALQTINQADAIPDLTLSFGYFISPIETRLGPQRAKFSLIQMFPWFGTGGAKENAAIQRTESKYQAFLDAKNELYYKVKAAYYPLYEIHVHIKQQKENLNILNTYKELATTSFSNNKGSMVDVIRVDIIIESVITEIQILEDQLKPLEIAFNRLLNRDESLQVEMIDSLGISNLQDSYQTRKDSILTANPMLKSVEFRIQSAIADEEVARKQGSPSLGIGIDYSIVGERTDIDVPDNGKNALMPMISMSLPIFRKKYKASIKEAQYTQTALLLAKEDMKNTLLTSFEMVWYEIEKAKLLHDQYIRQIEKTKQAISLLHSAYSNSGKEFEEVLRMEQQLLKYKMSSASNLKIYYLALAKLDYLSARELESMIMDL